MMSNRLFDLIALVVLLGALLLFMKSFASSFDATELKVFAGMFFTNIGILLGRRVVKPTG